jgi:hypothetical protein
MHAIIEILDPIRSAIRERKNVAVPDMASIGRPVHQFLKLQMKVADVIRDLIVLRSCAKAAKTSVTYSNYAAGQTNCGKPTYLQFPRYLH